MVHQYRPEPRRADPASPKPPRERYVGDPRWAPRLVARDRYAHPLMSLGLITPVVLFALAARMLSGYLAEADGTAPPLLAVPGLLTALVLIGLALWSVRRFVTGRRRAARRPVPLAVGPEGITTPDLGTLAWEDVSRIEAHIRWTSDDGSPVRYWQLSVIPARGPKAGQRVSIKDEQVLVTLEAVVDVIQAYCDVTMVTDRS